MVKKTRNMINIHIHENVLIVCDINLVYQIATCQFPINVIDVSLLGCILFYCTMVIL